MIPDLDREQRQRLARAYKARRRGGAKAVAAPKVALAAGAVCPQCGANARNGCDHYLAAQAVPAGPPEGDDKRARARFHQRRIFWGKD